MTLLAQIRNSDDAEQNLADHLTEVGELASIFTSKIGLANAGLLLGLPHDFGKYSRQFQYYILPAEGRNDADVDDLFESKSLKGKIDHSTAGAQHLWNELKRIGSAGQGGRVDNFWHLVLLLGIINGQKDSLRFNYFGSNWKGKVEHHGVNAPLDTVRYVILV